MAAPGGPHGRDGKKRNGRAVFFRQMDDGRLFRHRVARYVFFFVIYHDIIYYAPPAKYRSSKVVWIFSALSKFSALDTWR